MHGCTSKAEEQNIIMHKSYYHSLLFDLLITQSTFQVAKLPKNWAWAMARLGITKFTQKLVK